MPLPTTKPKGDEDDRCHKREGRHDDETVGGEPRAEAECHGRCQE